MRGYIKLYREITEHWIFQDAEKFKWWIDLLVMASHEDVKVLSNGNLISLKRGQLSVTLSFLQSRWGRSKEKILNFLRLLESDNMIEKISDRKSTLITICNYGDYQLVPKESPTTKPTDDRPLSDQSPTEYKNVEECKEINKQTNSAYAREENPSWDAEKEQGFYNTFKGLGSAVPMATKTGKSASEIMKLLDVYMAHRQLKNLGHSDYQCFVNLFSWHIDNNKISLPAQPVEQPKKKVKSNADFYKEMYG